ncbi:MAG: tape measure protein, partial [Geminicoccaceae bacterium]
MTRRDVDLVIRARDEAKGAIASVTSALEKFVDSQDDIQRATGQTDSVLDRLGASLSGLSKELGGVAAGTRIAQELERASASMLSLSQTTEKAAGEAIGYTREARQAARATEALKQESEQVAAAVARQRQAVNQAKSAQAELTSVTQRAATERRRLVEADEKLSNQIEQQRLKLALASAAFRDLQGEIARTEAPTKKLSNSFASTQRAVAATEAKLEELRTTQAVVRTSIEATARAAERANAIYAGQAASIDRQVTALERLEQKQREASGALTASAGNQAKLETEATRAATSLERQTASLGRAERAYEELSAAAGQTGATLARLEAATRGPLLRAFGQQAQLVNGLQQSYRETAAEATRLGRDIARLGDAAGGDLIADFERNREAARRAKDAFREQQVALGQLRRVLRETGGDLNEFQSRQQRFQVVLNRASAAYRSFEAATEAAARANQRSASEAARAAAQADRLASATRNQGNAARTAAGQTRTLSDAVRQFYGQSRTALSFTQRLRSEILSLAAAYGGLFAIFGGIRRSVDAFQQLEAAQSRLNAVFDGEQLAVTSELDFIRRNAERLGIEFGVLSDQYTKFAVATKDTNLEGAETRRIFISVAEAARVQKLSIDQVQGVFTALSQIVSKGSVQMEELRQQLGDRLPGAIQIMAAGLGVGTEELIKMLEAGEVSADALSGFATELDRRFGGQLPAALEQTTAAVGKFQNALFQTFLRIANGGFIDSFEDLIITLTETLQSAEFESFADRVSVALAGLTDLVAFAAQNWDTLVIAASAFIALKLAPFVTLLVAQMGTLIGSVVTAAGGFRSLVVAVGTGTASLSTLAVAARGATVALRSLLASTGVGIAVVAIGAAIGAWVTSTDDATEALNQHRKILDAVKNAYDQTTGSVEDWKDALEGATVTQARVSLQQLEEQLRRAQDAFDDAIPRDIFGDVVGAGGGFAAEVEALFRAYRDGTIDVDQFVDRLDALSETYRDLLPVNARLAETFDELARGIREANEPVAEARAIVEALSAPADEAQDVLDRLNGKVKETGDTAEDQAANAETFAGALDQIKTIAGEAAEGLERLQQAADLEKAKKQALDQARSIGSATQAFEEYVKAREALASEGSIDLGVGDDDLAQAAALTRRFQPFQATARETFIERDGEQVSQGVRGGFGSDTITLADGTIRQLTDGMTVARADADRDLIRRLAETRDVVRDQIGDVRFDSLAPGQQAAVTSVALEQGGLPEAIAQAVREGGTAEIAEAIRSLDRGSAVGAQQALVVEAAGPISDDALVPQQEEIRKQREQAAEAARREAERRADDVAKAQEATQERIANNDFQIAQQELVNAGLDRQAAIEAAIREAKQQNAGLTAEQTTRIGEQAAKLFDLQNQNVTLNQQRERAEAAEQRVNDLLALRRELQDQLSLQLQSGADAAAIETTELKIGDVNTRIREAIDEVIKLIELFGDGDVALEAMRTRAEGLKLTLEQTGQKAILTFGQASQVIANTGANAIE